VARNGNKKLKNAPFQEPGNAEAGWILLISRVDIEDDSPENPKQRPDEHERIEKGLMVVQIVEEFVSSEGNQQ